MTTQESIAQSAMLVSLSFTLPRQSKLNKAEAEKVEDTNSAKHGVAKVSVFYFQERTATGKTNDALADLKTFLGAWRSEHNRLTRPWDSGNTRLLPMQLIERYMNMKSRFEEEAPAIVQAFLAVVPTWAQSAPDRMGDLFDEEDFPTFDEVRQSISYDTAMIPLPTGEQWKRIAIISPDLAATMENTTNERVQKAVEEARVQTWKDVTKPLENIVNVLSKDRPRIFESLLGNLNESLDLLDAFNLSKDPDLTRFGQQARETLAGITAEDLRKDPELRKLTLGASKVLLSQFANPQARKFAA